MPMPFIKYLETSPESTPSSIATYRAVGIESEYGSASPEKRPPMLRKVDGSAIEGVYKVFRPLTERRPQYVLLVKDGGKWFLEQHQGLKNSDLRIRPFRVCATHKSNKVEGSPQGSPQGSTQGSSEHFAFESQESVSLVNKQLDDLLLKVRTWNSGLEPIENPMKTHSKGRFRNKRRIVGQYEKNVKRQKKSPEKVSSNSTAYDLKVAILNSKPHDLRGIDADRLTLWLTEFPDEDVVRTKAVVIAEEIGLRTKDNMINTNGMNIVRSADKSSLRSLEH
ncbi:MAG: hypothetical protein J3Q66DRAFT_414758 [Benniella sp.]|nr:MAG: hypothetical protein J3Q66DRAFT_414758 [Benniella sp.]